MKKKKKQVTEEIKALQEDRKQNLNRVFEDQSLTTPLAKLGDDFKMKYWKKSKIPQIVRVCLYCKKMFICNLQNRFYCSEECRKNGDKEWRKDYYKNNSEKFKKLKKKYYKKNRERLRTKMREHMRNKRKLEKEKHLNSLNSLNEIEKR